VKYLSQQFVEHLCSEDQLSAGLLSEIESVIFAHLDPSDRLNAYSFDELRAVRVAPMRESRQNAEERILELSDRISVDLDQAARLPALRDRLKRLETDEKALEEEIARLVESEQPAIAKEHAKALQAASQAQDRVAVLKQQRQGLDLFAARLEHAAKMTSDSVAQLQQAARQLELPEGVLDALKPRPLTSALAIIADRRGLLDSSIERSTKAVGLDADGRESLQTALDRLKTLEMKLNLDSARKKRLEDTQRALTSKKAEADKLRQEISRIQDGQAERLAAARDERSALYALIFDEIRREEGVLRELYAPLADSLARGNENEKRLEFSVRRTIDVEAWAARGEDLVDQRKRPRDQKTLIEHAREHMVDNWQRGDAAAIATGIGKLVAASVGHLQYLRKEVTRRDFARWLFSTEHVALEYGIGFDGVDLKNLSPGTKGIVLLILYLAVDTADRRPLVIDQPEENLDPKSVYDVLVPYFREAKKRRQIIIITHNANLVVNTDAEQIIVASASRIDGQALPAIEYESGALETKAIRDAVCDILEGGKRAFRQRERKYGLHG
jgi:ABC-type lipoprotein export system ATPase subunit